MESGFLLPDLDDVDARPFWEGTARGELLVQPAPSAAARACRRGRCARIAARPQHEWKPMSGRGTIWSFVVPHPPLLPAYAELAPYNVIAVALDEDPTHPPGRQPRRVAGRRDQRGRSEDDPDRRARARRVPAGRGRAPAPLDARVIRSS